MRDAINNNPRVQLAVIGVLILLAGIVLVPSMMGGGSGSSSSGTTTNTTSAQVTAPNGQTANVTVESTAPTGATPSATGAVGATGATGAVPPPTTVDPSALVPGQGLPAPFINAWKDGKAVVLLVVRNHGIDDELVRRSVQGLSGDSNLAVFTVRANKVARYARITQGVGVSQAPALIIVRPKRLSGSVPQAQVAYGFRDSQTVVQYVHDALYKGKDDLPYSPR